MMIEDLVIAMVMIGEGVIAMVMLVGEVIVMATETRMIGIVVMMADMETEICVGTMAQEVEETATEVAMVTEIGEDLIVLSRGGMVTDQIHPILPPLRMIYGMALQGIHNVTTKE